MGCKESGMAERTFTTTVTDGKGYDWVKCHTVSSFLKKLFLFWGGVFVAAHGLSLVAASRGHSLVAVC